MKSIRQALSTIKKSVYQTNRPALNDLDRKLDKYLDFSHGFFIEAGANDGYSQSNTYCLEKTRDWTGILIEGIPALYEKCKRVRANSRVYNCALVAKAFPSATVTMHFAGLMSVVSGSLKTAEAQQTHIQSGLDVQHLDRSYDVDVPARTLESILDETPNLPAIDFFSLDVEGYERDVLHGMNIDKYAPQYILVEARFYEDVNSYLQTHYEQLEQLAYHDYLYRRKRSG